MKDRVRVRVVVTGRVQGVWYRESCRRQAMSLGVAGWVRNRLDGAVEAVLEGTEQEVAMMVAWCRRGPARAEVVAVDVAREIVEVGEVAGDHQGLVGFRVL